MIKKVIIILFAILILCINPSNGLDAENTAVAIIVAPEEPQETPQEDIRTFVVTAYTSRQAECGKPPGHKDYGRTKSGVMAKVGVTISAGPDIPLGTKILFPELTWINGTGEFIVQDRGGKIKAGHIDLYMGDPEKDKDVVKKAYAFGRQTMEGSIQGK